jgi:hypothetical protein
MNSRLAAITILVIGLPLLGCQLLVGRATTRLAADFSAAVLDQDDPLIVRDGGPAYLIAIDGMIEGSPENQTLLLAGARLYAAYASAFVEDSSRAARLALRAKVYGERALCAENAKFCGVSELSFDEFEEAMTQAGPLDVDALYGLGSAWASWIQANSSDWSAIADIPKVQSLMERVVEIDSDHESGGAHLFLGILYTLRPASMGGQPEVGREHFESSIELSDGKNLTAKMLFARQYARLVFDKELHDRLLNEVVSAEPKAKGFTLSNMMAQDEARELLADSDEYF